MKTYTIQINHRIDFVFNNSGFDFIVSGIPQFQDWLQFKYYYPLYLCDGIKDKIYKFCDSLPDRFKAYTFYQALKFE
jgi:hypothetical protein